ncbi:MAG: imidazole glycerol phosphate synthase subunit HisH, partial [Bdellovibrionota bacterium]
MSKVTIIDYGCGNLFNLVNALEEVGISSKITDSPTEARKSDRLILPGVGAFGHGVQNLNQRNLTESVLEVAKAGRPVMGICLGMQLLATKSEELGTWDGLDLIPGEVRSLRDMGA